MNLNVGAKLISAEVEKTGEKRGNGRSLHYFANFLELWEFFLTQLAKCRFYYIEDVYKRSHFILQLMADYDTLQMVLEWRVIW